MIHKINRLTSIGKYRNYNASGDVAFKKLTLFYADNGSGKTTLTSVLRSLTLNKPELINRRKSTNATTTQAAQIIQRNATGDIHHTFNEAKGWTTQLPEIEIFDIHFVNENIYSGFDFNDEQKKQLHQFVIGAAGITIQNQIEQNKLDKANSRQLQDNLVQQIIQNVGNNLTIDLINSFISIPNGQQTNIDQKITIAETELANANANSVIQTLQNLVPILPLNLNLDFDTLKSDLVITSQALQDSALKSIFTNHCQNLNENNIDSPENWLRIGFSYLEKKKVQIDSLSHLDCPFCTQPIVNQLDIINAYTLQFNTDFNLLVKKIQTYCKILENFNLDTFIQTLNSNTQINIGRVASWSIHLPKSVQAPTFNIANAHKLKADFQELVLLVTQKLQNPSLAVSVPDTNNFETDLQLIKTNIDSYNQNVISYNQVISQFKASIQTIVHAQTEVFKLKRIKKRFETSINSLCSQLTSEKQTLKSLETAYPLLIEQQRIASEFFFTDYKNRINHYLGTVFKTLFRIEDVVNVPPQGKAIQSKIGYKLTIDGQDISFDPNQLTNAKDCLSEGDKSTIALAFFLSKLDIDQTINNKILVFDDPLSSFDSNRRMYTVQLIKDLFPNIKQIIVLSHNEYFLYELSKCFPAGDKKTLRIIENFLVKASTIEPLILETMVENDYFKHIKELEIFLQSPDLNKKDTVLGWLRNVLESHLRFKFHRQLSSLPSNNQTFGNLITALINQGIVFRQDSNKLTIISKLNLINGISCKPHHGEPIPDYSILGSDPNVMTVTELAHFITDTFNLIDNEI